MSKMFRIICATVALFSATAASAANILVCGSSGQTYIINGNTGTASPAGGCAGGPWVIELFLVPSGVTGETNWRDNPILESAVSVLTRLPNRDLRWSRTSPVQAALAQNLNVRGRLSIRADRLPTRVARSLRQDRRP